MVFRVTSSRRIAQVPRSAGFQQGYSSAQAPRSLLKYTHNQDWCGHLWDLACDTLTHAPSPVTLHLCILTCATQPMTPLSPVTLLSPMTPSPVHPHQWHLHLSILTCETLTSDTFTCAPSPVPPNLWHPHLSILTCTSSLVHPHLWDLTCATSPVTTPSPVTPLSPVTPSPVYPHL